MTHNELKFTAPLTAITAAVVGVIVNLLLFFAYHVFWKTGFSGTFDWAAAGVSLLMAVLLFHCKRTVIEVILLAMTIGLAIYGISYFTL